MADQPEPCPARRRSVHGGVEPAVLHAGDHREREHARARSFGPGLGVIDELAPQAVIALVLEQRGHHLVITVHDPAPLRVRARQRAQQLRHAGGDPAVAAAPEKRRVGCMEEQPVRLLEAVEICRHGPGGAVEVHGIAGRAEGLGLQQRDHVHVVDPIPGFGGDAVGRGCRPLRVGEPPSERKVFGFPRHPGEFERDGAEDAVVDVFALGEMPCVVGEEQGIELLDQAGLQVAVAGQLRDGQRAVPGANLRIMDRPLLVLIVRVGVLIFELSRHEIDGDPPAHVLRRRSGRPVGEGPGIGARARRRGKEQECGREQGAEGQRWFHGCEENMSTPGAVANPP